MQEASLNLSGINEICAYLILKKCENQLSVKWSHAYAALYFIYSLKCYHM